METSKKVIWVTGGSSGIGQAIAKNFAKIGCKVYISGRRNTELERTQKQFSKEKIKVEILPCNIASEINVNQTVKQIINKENKIDCLINNAGITYFKSFKNTSLREIKDVINTNLLGAIFCTNAVLDKMIDQKSGVIINISSVAANNTYKGSSIYSASKAGLNAFSRVLREEVREYGIKVINILPGATETAMWSTEHRKMVGAKMMNPDDLAHIVVSLFLQPENLTTEEIIVRPISGDVNVES